MKRSNHAIRWKKNRIRKSKIYHTKLYNKTKMKFYKLLGRDRREVASSVSRLNGRDLASIRSTKTFCQFTLMTRSIVPHIKINKHAFKQLSREGYLVNIHRA